MFKSDIMTFQLHDWGKCPVYAVSNLAVVRLYWKNAPRSVERGALYRVASGLPNQKQRIDTKCQIAVSLFSVLILVVTAGASRQDAVPVQKK